MKKHRSPCAKLRAILKTFGVELEGKDRQKVCWLFTLLHLGRGARLV